MIFSAGDSRKSSVLGLNVSPSRQTLRPASSPPKARRIFCSISGTRDSLTSIVARTMRSARPCSRAISSIARVSLGKHEPP